MSSRLQGLEPQAIQWLSAAGQALDMGKVEQASQCLAKLGAHARHPEVLRMQAGIHSMRGQHQQAIDAMRQALRLRSDDAVYLNTLGSLQGAAGRYDEAVDTLQRACRLQPELALAWYNLGVMLVRCVRNEEAIAALRQAVARAPGHAQARAQLADLLRTEGRNDEATGEYRRILAEQPWTGMAWWGLADLKTHRFSDDDIRAMQQALRHPQASDDERVAIGFALAKAYDDSEQYAQALEALAQANAIARRQQTWNADAFSEQVRTIQQAFASPAHASDGSLGAQVIFITSLPRSGSTLVEQILASHSQVEGAGELHDLPHVLAEESRRRGLPFPQWVNDASPQDWERLGRRYLERTQHWRQQRPRSLDKLPNNWMYIDAIRAMLPAAKIICCRRDPLETCFSCYRQRLAHNEYTRRFDDLARFWRDFDQAARNGAARYPDHVMEYGYEAMLDDPEQAIRRLLAFCGLSFEPACLSFHENTRQVRSPSANQVRQPLRRDTARTNRYGPLLNPLRDALGLSLV